MRLFLTSTPQVLHRCNLTSGSRPELLIATLSAHRTPTINHAPPAFIENKRYRPKPRAIGDVVNRNAVRVYQTDAVLILIGRVQRRCSGARKN
jgi:hypothetical protein